MSAATEKPSKPTNLHVTDIWKDYMTVVWEAPKSDGGSPITGYTLEQRDAFDVNYKFVASLDANTTQYQVCLMVNLLTCPWYMCTMGQVFCSRDDQEWLFTFPLPPIHMQNDAIHSQFAFLPLCV